jgi:type II secretory pathway predicted ATPase ExeA
MNRKTLHALFGLKWNPFTPDVPVESLWIAPRVESFCTRVEHMVTEGGFALITGEPGSGKSVTLRLLRERLSNLPDVAVAILSRPQSAIVDFYRELGELFSVDLKSHNRWGGFKLLRERWRTHAEASRLRPILLVDEAQEMPLNVLNELRILSSGELDTELYLTTVLAADGRLLERFRTPELLPFSSRLRTRILLDHASQEDLREVLHHGLKKAGRPDLLSATLEATLVEHAAGNLRSLMTLAGELLLTACERNLNQLDEKLFFELYQDRTPRRTVNSTTRAAKAR